MRPKLAETHLQQHFQHPYRHLAEARGLQVRLAEWLEQMVVLAAVAPVDRQQGVLAVLATLAGTLRSKDTRAVPAMR